MFKGIKTDGRSFGGSTSTEGRVKQIQSISKYHLRLINTLLLSQLSHKEVSNYTLKSTNGELVLSFQCKDVITPSKKESEGEKGEPHLGSAVDPVKQILILIKEYLKNSSSLGNMSIDITERIIWDVLPSTP